MAHLASCAEEFFTLSFPWLVGRGSGCFGENKNLRLIPNNKYTHTTGWWEGNNTKGGGEDSKSRFCGAINRPPIFSLLSRTLSPQQVTMAINRREGLQHLKTLGQFERAKTCLERFLLFVGAKWKSFKAKKKKIFSRNSRRSGVEKTFVIGPQNGVGRCLVTDLRAVMYGQS